MKTTTLLTIILSLILSTAAIANEHPMTVITGPGIDLKAYDHAIAGSINGTLVFGNKDEGKFESELIVKKDGELIRTIFKKDATRVGGTIRTSTMEFVSADQKEQTLLFRINSKDLTVRVTADAFRDGHFFNPTYTTEFDGKKIEFHFVNGQACYGFSIHLVFMIVGAYLLN